MSAEGAAQFVRDCQSGEYERRLRESGQQASSGRNDMPLWRAIGRLPDGGQVLSGIRFRTAGQEAAETIGRLLLRVWFGVGCEFVKVEMLEHGKVREAKGCDLKS